MDIKTKLREKNNIYTFIVLLDTIIFFNFFKSFLISNNWISINNIIFITFIFAFWLILNYILGNYQFKNRKLFNVFFKQFFNSCFAIILYTPFIIIFTFNYNLTDIFSIIFLFSKINFISFLIHILTFSINNFINRKPLIWLFIGDEKIFENLLIECKKLEFNDKIIMLKDKKNINYDGIIIDDNLKDVNTLEFKNNILLSNWLGKYLQKYPVDLISNLFFLDKSSFASNSLMQLRIKEVFEKLISMSLIIIFSPLILISSIFIYLEDGLPIFYSQNRNGLFNKKIKITKLRTMKNNAEKDGVQWSKKNDKRITKIGSFIRKIRVDELPQLISVLKGEMSLIGPRPERPEIDLMLSKEIQNYNIRYNLKPGLSGWAQVNYPYGASIQDAKNKLSYDLYYVKNFSNLLDIKILFMTIKLVFNAKGAIAKK
ncbi:hypothetical protein CUB78_06635 [Prochlorococcus marinus str. XMU1401]|nr:hypothetical protein [Prochlorococcus marinus str. XMU1401E]PJC83625.1 hypothetical protein CUB78_06635 [Prochlorococcus marinus str. XMU1401]